MQFRFSILLDHINGVRRLAFELENKRADQAAPPKAVQPIVHEAVIEEPPEEQPAALVQPEPVRRYSVPSRSLGAGTVVGPAPKVTKRSASSMRAVKVAIYAALGQLLALGTLFVTELLGAFEIPYPVAITVGFMISGILAGIHKAINWKDEIGYEPPSPEMSTLPPIAKPTKESANV